MDDSKTGQVPTQRKDKAQLLKTHSAYLKKQGQNPATARAVKQPGVSDAYPPSTKSIRELELVPLSDLRVGIHHRGQGVIVKTISNAYRGIASVSVVEDGHGNVDKLAVYNQSDSSILYNLPEDCIVAVREPFYKCNAGGGDDYMICVDHPSDVFLLRLSDPIIPGPLRPEVSKTAEEWKKAGDQAFLLKDLPRAVFCYTEGIHAAPGESAVRADLLSKRAGSNLALGKFDDAQADALASRTGTSADWKSYSTAGRAAYGLRDYQASHDHFQKALELKPDEPAVRRELARCLARLTEEKQGDYDFRKMYETLSPRTVHLDHASFTARTHIADSPLHGQGLFAKDKIKAGELVFCEKAAIMPNQYEPSRASAALYAMMVRQLLENPSLGADLLALHHGGGDQHTRSGREGDVVDGVPVVDVWLAEAIRRRNCFSAPLSTRDETRPRRTTARGAAGATAMAMPSTTKGLWPHASRMNHACVPNTARSFVGDMLVSRALRDVKPGEELVHNYANIKAQHARRQAEFGSSWGFACACALCAAEARSADERAGRRAQLLAQMEKLASKKPPAAGERVLLLPEATIRSMERLAREMEEAHEPEVYGDDADGTSRGVPRLMLVYPTMWLLEAYKGRKNHAKVVATAHRVLRNFGFEMEGGEEDVGSIFGRRRERPSVLTIHVVTSLRDAASAHRSMGRKDMASQFEEVARFGYMMLTGFETDLSLLDGA